MKTLGCRPGTMLTPVGYVAAARLLRSDAIRIGEVPGAEQECCSQYWGSPQGELLGPAAGTRSTPTAPSGITSRFAKIIWYDATGRQAAYEDIVTGTDTADGPRSTVA